MKRSVFLDKISRVRLATLPLLSKSFIHTKLYIFLFNATCHWYANVNIILENVLFMQTFTWICCDEAQRKIANLHQFPFGLVSLVCKNIWGVTCDVCWISDLSPSAFSTDKKKKMLIHAAETCKRQSHGISETLLLQLSVICSHSGEANGVDLHYAC